MYFLSALLGRMTGLFRCAPSPCKIVRTHNRRTAVRLFVAVRTAFSPVQIRILTQK